MSNYSEYTVRVTNDPQAWGESVTKQMAQGFAETHADHLRAQFDGIEVEIVGEIPGRSVSGPDAAVIDEIRDWISNYWTAAL
jgi:hypothetical protein